MATPRKPTRQAPPLTVIDLCRDKNLLNLSLSPAQETILRSFYGLALSPEQKSIYKAITGRSGYTPGHEFSELTVIAGARSGKDSRIACPIAIFESLFGGHESRLHTGESAIVACVAQDKPATDVLYSYIMGAILESAYLSSMLAEEPLTSELRFKNRIRVVCFPSSLKSLRAWSICCGIMDEVAFFRAEGNQNSDAEIQSSIRRGMVSFGESAKLIKISTPFSKDGILWQDHQQAFGKDDRDQLVVVAPTALMNPEVYGSVLQREQRRDPTRYAREFEARFAENLESFLPESVIQSAVVPGRMMLPAQGGRAYFAGLDVSGGGSCAFALSICSVELLESGKHRIIECLTRGWERAKGETLNLEGVVSDACSILLGYGISQVLSDRYSAGWSKQSFARHGITLIDAPDKSSIYAEAEVLFTAGRLELCDTPETVRELSLLERRPRPGGKALIGPPRGGHDDYSNALCLAAVSAAQNADTPPVDYRPTLAECQNIAAAFPEFEFHTLDLDGDLGLR